MKILACYLFSCTLFFLSCTSNINEFEETVNFENHWNFNDSANFNLKINNKKPKTLNVLVRNNNDYEFSNLYLFIHHIHPNGKKEIDTLQYFLADSRGKWLGSGLSEIKQNLLEISPSKKYSIGNHKIKIFHGMRKKNLLGLEDLTLILN